MLHILLRGWGLLQMTGSGTLEITVFDSTIIAGSKANAPTNRADTSVLIAIETANGYCVVTRIIRDISAIFSIMILLNVLLLIIVPVSTPVINAGTISTKHAFAIKLAIANVCAA